MKYLSGILILLVAASCSSPNTNTASTDTVAAGETLTKEEPTATTNNASTISSMCFVRTEGTRNQDTTTIQLVVKGNKVTGEMSWIPAEKDSRKGILTGTKSGDMVNATWTFKQEGMTDSMRLAFKIDGHNLLQKPLKADPKTGRQETDESAGYTIQYQPSISLKR